MNLALKTRAGVDARVALQLEPLASSVAVQRREIAEARTGLPFLRLIGQSIVYR